MRFFAGSRRRVKAGYTLTEIIVTFVVLAILSLISVGGFLAATNGSKQQVGFSSLQAVQSGLRASSVATGGIYSSTLITSLSVSGVVISGGEVLASGTVSVAVDPSNNTQAVMATVGSDTGCVVLVDSPMSATRYGQFTITSSFRCNASALTAGELAQVTSSVATSPSVMVA